MGALDLTKAEIALLSDTGSIAEWAARARTIMSRDGVTHGSLARGTGLPLHTIKNRLHRYPAL